MIHFHEDAENWRLVLFVILVDEEALELELAEDGHNALEEDFLDPLEKFAVVRLEHLSRIHLLVECLQKLTTSRAVPYLEYVLMHAADDIAEQLTFLESVCQDLLVDIVGDVIRERLLHILLERLIDRQALVLLHLLRNVLDLD